MVEKKRILNVLIIACMVLALCMNAAFAGESKMQFTIESWFPTVSGAVSPVGNNIDFRDDLNLGKYNPIGLGVRYAFTPKHHLSLSYIGLENKGSSRLARGFNYQGHTFGAGSMVDSSLKTSFVDLRYDFNVGKSDASELNLLIGLKATDMNVKVSQVGGVTSEQNISLPIPEIGFNFKQELSHQLSLTGDFSMANWSRKGNTVMNSDYRAGLNWFFGEGWSLDLGYRNMWLSGKDSDSNNMDLRYEGPNFMLKFAH